MAQKILVPLTSLVGNNEQSGAVPLTVTASGNSREYGELGAFSSGVFLLDVSAVGGTGPTLDVKVQGYDPLAGKWHDVVTFPTQNAVTSGVVAAITSTIDYQLYRAVWTVGGTSGQTFTFTLGVILHTAEPVTVGG